jgi:hypothetical protein
MVWDIADEIWLCFLSLELIPHCTEHIECFTAISTGHVEIPCSGVGSFLSIHGLDEAVFKFLCVWSASRAAPCVWRTIK